MATKQTAMKVLMEWMIEESQVIPVDAEDTYNKAKELLAMEKEQIEKSFQDSMVAIVVGKVLSPEQYYKETYNNQDNDKI